MSQGQGVLVTKRLRLEPIGPSHFDGLRVINGNPDVMRYIGAGMPETVEGTKLFMERVQKRWSEQRFSWWAFIDRSEDVVGCGPLQYIEGDPCKPHEIGWRVRRDRWGLGYAAEAAQAIRDYAFDQMRLPLALAVAKPANKASIRVMEKIGMRRRGIETHYGQPCVTFEATASRRHSG